MSYNKKIIVVILSVCIPVTGLFLVAGDWAWWNGWSLIVLMGIIGSLTARLFNKTPGLAEERKAASAKSRPWDVNLVRILNISFPLMLLLAALDMRFHWCVKMPALISIIAFVLIALASTLTYYAIATNPFFSSHIRIQTDRGHTAVDSGPYRWMRHPGYAGSMVFNSAVPFALGSWLALPIGIITTLLLLIRTRAEDRILTEELAGYPAYRQRVRSRLIPGLW